MSAYPKSWNEKYLMDILVWPCQSKDGQKNGELLRLAASEFDVFITIDNNLSAQQNFTKIDLAVIVLSAPNNRLETLKPLVQWIKEVMASIHTGEIVYI